MIIKSDIEGASVYINGESIGKIREGKLSKAINRDAEITLDLKAEGYYNHSEKLVMDEEKVIYIEMEKQTKHLFAFDAVFGSGMMGSFNLSVFPIPSWWFIGASAGFTVSNVNPILINLPLSLKSGAYMIPDNKLL